MNANINDFIGKNVHMIGIGGSSMSGLAYYLKTLGCNVSGSDRKKNHKTDKLAEMGITVYEGQKEEQVNGKDLIIFSAAVPDNNPERAEAKRLLIPQIERCELLGQLMEGRENAICISGTHGKTSTTSMMAQVFYGAGLDPTIHIGGELDFIGGSTRVGQGSEFIVEACEYNRSFMSFKPTVAIITNIDEDHLDFYGNIDNIEQAFYEFASLVPEDGWVIGWGGDKRVRNVLEKLKCHTRTYGLEPFNEIRAEDISYSEDGRPHYTVTLFGHPLCEVDLGVAGEHNILNSLAVITASDILQVSMSAVAENLASFKNAHRRNELTSVTDGVYLFTDYGHNPAEIKNALKLANLHPHQKLWSVWQPHTYSRTKSLFDGFLETFYDCDCLLITDIMGDREQDPGDIKTEMFIEPLKQRGVNVVHTPTFDDAEKYLREHWQKGDLVISHGCGDIYLLNEQIAAHGDTKK